MSNNQPINMEDAPGDVPSDIPGREVNPDQDETTAPNTKIVPADEHMEAVLEHIPDELKERVSKLTRTELAMPGVPRDRDAYEAYLGAEKIIRDLARRKNKAKFSWDGVKKQNG